MAKKKVTAVIKLQCPAQKATPAPPIGPALGPHGVSAPQFVQQFNDKTKGYEPGLILPVIITRQQAVPRTRQRSVLLLKHSLLKSHRLSFLTSMLMTLKLPRRLSQVLLVQWA